jgi:hypothetical protein
MRKTESETGVRDWSPVPRLQSRVFRLVSSLVLGLGLLSSRSAAQEARLISIRDDATRDRVRAFIEAAQRRGTPTEPLIARALEGVAFKADAKRIEKAMVDLEKRLRRAHDLLGRNSTVDEIAAAADALANKIPERAITDLRRAAPNRSITVELGVLTELVLRGASPKDAAKMVRDLMAHGATGAQLTALNEAVQQDVALGVSPIDALQVRGRGVMSLLPPRAGAVLAQPRP